MRAVIGAVALCGALLTVGNAQAETIGHYQSRALHYAVSYPATWSRIGLSGADFAAVSGDRNDFVSVSVVTGKANAVQVQRALDGAFGAFGRPLGGPSYRPFPIHGAIGTLAQDAVRSPGGAKSLVLAFMLSRHGLLYLALGVVRDVSPHSGADVSAALGFIADTAIV
jgi:hypothetical protein